MPMIANGSFGAGNEIARDGNEIAREEPNLASAFPDRNSVGLM
jgi:hypothetical protein